MAASDKEEKDCMTRKSVSTLALASALLAPTFAHKAQAQMADFRPPSVPLVTHDPLFSIWSPSDKLYSSDTVHWTRREHALSSLIRVDGETYRLMGTKPEEAGGLKQVGLTVTPTRSVYEFQNKKVHVTLTFMAPLLPDDLDVLARPVTYLIWDVRSVDGQPHTVSLFQSTAAALAVNNGDEPVAWSRETIGGLIALKTGASEPTLLLPAGDDTRINWGQVYAAALSAQAQAGVGASGDLLDTFLETGKLPASDDIREPRAANDASPTLAFVFDLGKVGTAPVSRHLMLALDEFYAIQFLQEKQRPYWRRSGATMQTLLPQAEKDYVSLRQRCVAFDAALMADLTKAGGARYAQLSALAYRQSLAGCGYAADTKGMPMIYPKENSSNGCIATTDIFFPAAPQFLLMGSAFAKALVAPVLVYSASPRWKFPFAPHDIGVYPRANGQVYGGGETSKNEADMMPVEESGNMLILMLAIAKMEGNADFASRWWPQLTAWEGYLEKYGEDPGNQLCTDDFMGHLAHNANLSVKAILAIAAYGELCRMRGDTASADKFQRIAKEYATHWQKVSDDGDHSRLAFDKPNTWSQKYNLVWDRIIGLNVFPATVAAEEVAYYKKQLQSYGVPLDSRTRLTKTDWSLWTATMADSKADFETLVSPIYDYLTATTDRLPFVDSYVTDTKHYDGFRARPVVGGVFIKMIADPVLWKKYAAKGAKAGNEYAPAPVAPVLSEVVASSEKKAQTWRYTTEKPTGDWFKADYDDANWKEGKGGFGTEGTPGAVIGTEWRSKDIWLRRTVTLPTDTSGDLQMYLHHDDAVEVYLSGVLAVKEAGYTGKYEPTELRDAAKAQLKPGASVVIAIHCHQDVGGQFIDAGIARSVPQKP